MIKIREIKLELEEDESLLAEKVSAMTGIPTGDILSLKIVRKSVDARKGHVCFSYTLEISVRNEKAVTEGKNISIIPDPAPGPFPPGEIKRKPDIVPVIVGAGPAGLFAALTYVRMGYRPVILERGQGLEKRIKDVDRFRSEGKFDPESNIHFGAGGAGTFSDGKLATGIKDQLCGRVLEEFVRFGAPEEILYVNKPHIGTDNIRKVVGNICSYVTDNGGVFRFGTKVTGLSIEEGRITGLSYAAGSIETDTVILAVGNCARDTVNMLFGSGIEIKQKNFAVGIRIEHPRRVIDTAQYKRYAGHPRLGAADYKLVSHSPKARSAYTFCMCPGGYVVPASCEEGTVATNGMSEYKRDAVNSNSAIVVGVGSDDLESPHPLAGIEYQRKLERAAFAAGGSDYRAPVQLVRDFMSGKPSVSMGSVIPTYMPGFVPDDIGSFLPGVITAALKEAIRSFSGRISGFMMGDAVITGVETQTSSPFRIVRDDDLMTAIKGLYAAGEGSGYAGGIMSSAVDGIKAALASARE
ncbi:MAG: hypothetical protein JXJ19_01445 [Elusimicrobia bacterium]|nr:hypothetical protein [Elusimicrobiota bacterium]